MFANVEESQVAKLLNQKDYKEFCNQFCTFLLTTRESGGFKCISKQELDENLRLFHVSIRTKTGTNLEGSLLNKIMVFLNIHKTLTKQLHDNQRPELNKFKKKFTSALTDMKKKGFELMDHKLAIFTEGLNKLFNSESIVFYLNTPCGLQAKSGLI